MKEPQKEKGQPRAVRVYADTSVFGGVFDPEFSVSSGKFFQQVKEGRFRVVPNPTSDVVPSLGPEPSPGVIPWIARNIQQGWQALKNFISGDGPPPPAEP